MYTWSYIKSVTLAKLDLDETEAMEQDLFNKFPYYANEAMTQICSTVKPKHTFVKFKVADKLTTWKALTLKYNVYLDYSSPIIKPKQLSTNEELFWNEFESYNYVGESVTMPDDFIAFDDDVNIVERDYCMYECHDDDFSCKGYNQLMFFKTGNYTISYKARWYFFKTFTKETENSVITAPADVLDCIPSYIASQCYRIDDDTKSQILRNEYEIFLSRLDDTNYKQTKTFTIGGDW